MLPFAEIPAPESAPGIGWLLVGLGAIFLILNQGADFIARFRAKEPVPPDPPLHKEYAGRHEVAQIHTQIQEMRAERSRSVGNLHEKIESTAKENRQLFSDLRDEFKGDIEGVHERVNEQLKAWAKLEGRIDEALKKTNHPFPG